MCRRTTTEGSPVPPGPAAVDLTVGSAGLTRGEDVGGSRGRWLRREVDRDRRLICAVPFRRAGNSRFSGLCTSNEDLPEWSHRHPVSVACPCLEGCRKLHLPLPVVFVLLQFYVKNPFASLWRPPTVSTIRQIAICCHDGGSPLK